MQMLPISGNVMSGCLPQGGPRRSSLPIMLTIRNEQKDSVTGAPTSSLSTLAAKTGDNHLELQKDSILLSKRKKSNHIQPQ